MIILISGPNSSGKSSLAEKIMCRRSASRQSVGCGDTSSGDMIYIATMICRNEENAARIRKHRDRRKDMGFRTEEEPYDLDKVSVSCYDSVLLEDLSNLLANVIFDKDGNASEVLRQIETLNGRCGDLVIVTIGGLDPAPYDGETADYIESLNKLNAAIAERSSVHIEMEAGTPIFRKGRSEDVN